MSAPEYTRRNEWSRTNNSRTDPDEVFIMDNWEAAITVAESEDPFADYSFHNYALIQIGADYFVVSGRGCSCPTMEEVWEVDFRGDREAVEKYISEDRNYEAWREFQREVHTAGWANIPNPKPRENRYDWGE